MAKRKIIKINTEDCTGCGQCIPNCPEGALQIIDGKARLISDLFCDGLGACIGHCPYGAITTEEREAEKYDETKVMENIIKHGPNTIKAHLEHLKGHGEEGYLKEALEALKKKGIKNPLEENSAAKCRGNFHSCPGAKVLDLRNGASAEDDSHKDGKRAPSALRQWPVQIMLVPAFAPYLNNADLLIAADCVPFAYADFHSDLLKGKAVLVGCPKLDDTDVYRGKFVEIFKNNTLKSVTYAHMEVPCCSGLIGVIKDAIKASGKNIPFRDVTITIKGERAG